MNCLGVIKAYISTLIHESTIIYGIGFHVHRLLNRKSLKSIKQFKKTHLNERCFIIGTGPSLRIDDIRSLKYEKCFGVNTLCRLYDKTDWRPDFYCVIDPNTYKNTKDELIRNEVKNLFYPINRIKEIIPNGIPFEMECSDFYKIYLGSKYITKFSDDAENYIYDGASVVYAALQLAVYMGFKNIYLLGVDCNYALPKEDLHNPSLSYSAGYNYNWTKQTGFTMIEGFKVARKYADEHGINIYNATRGGMLEVFPRVDLEDVVGGVIGGKSE